MPKKQFIVLEQMVPVFEITDGELKMTKIDKGEHEVQVIKPPKTFFKGTGSRWIVLKGTKIGMGRAIWNKRGIKIIKK